MIGLLLPSYQRPDDLAKVLEQTPLSGDARFFVVANYEPDVYQKFVDRFSDRATFVDERQHGRLGGCKAYNLAHKTAAENGATYVIHYADDILPADANWLQRIEEL